MAKSLEIGLDITPEIDESRLSAVFELIEKAFKEATDSPLISPKALSSLDRASKEIDDVQKELAEAGVAGVKAFDRIGNEADQAAQKGGKLGQALGKAFVANQAVEFAQKAADSLNEVISVGAEFEASLAAVGAITGQSGEALDVLGGRARELALAFGGPATSQLESFQGVLSKFGAQVADSPAALGKLATNINTLSAASGDDAKTSMNAITDAMLQFGLVTGDANKDAETSTRIINGLAASAQVGAAEIPQVAEAILQAGVAAKGANLSFESTNAALQVLAIGGKTGSEAGVGLRNVLGLIQKASGPAEIAMSKLGTSSKELGELLTTKGLDVALAKIKGGMDNLGTAAEKNVALMDIFGTENSAVAGILLDNVDQFKAFEEGIIAGQQGVGAAFEQAAIRMNTSKTSIAQAKAFIEDQFISIFQTFGSGLSTTLGATAQIAPMVTTLAGLKEVFPVEAAGKFAKTLITETVPGLFKSVAGYIASAGAKSAEAVATGTATVAQTALNLVMSANPVFLLVAGIGLLVGAYLLFGNSTKDLKDATEDANASLTKLNEATAQEAAVKKNSESIDKLAGNYKKLQLSTALIAASGGDASASQRELAATAEELAKRVPEAADAVGDLAGKAGESAPKWDINTEALKRYNEEQEKIAKENASDALADFDDQNKALFESVSANTEKMKELREQRDLLNTPQGQEQAQALDGLENALGGPIVGIGKFVGLIDSADDKLGTVRESINKISPELEKAKKQQTESIAEYGRMGFSIDDVAEKLGVARDVILTLAPPDFAKSLVNSEALKKSIEGMGKAQQQVVNKVINQTEALQGAQTKAAELKEGIANALAIGDTDTADKLKKDLEGVQEEISKNEITLKTTVDSEEAKEALKALPEEAKGLLKPLQATVDMVVSEQSLKDTAQAGGKLIREIGELQKQRDAATSESQKALLDDKINAKTVELTKNLGTQGEAIAANTDRLNSLKAAKESASDPKEVLRLTGEIASLEKKTGDASVRLVEAAKSSQKVGATKGDINQLAGSYGSASNAGRGIGIAMKTAAENTKEVGEAVKDVGAEFEEAQKKANDIVNTLASQYAANLIKLKGDLDQVTREKIVAQQAEIERQAKAIQADLRQFKSASDQAQQALGFNAEVDEKASRDRARKAAEDRRKASAEAIKHQAELRAIRQKAAAEEIEDELAKKLRDITITLDKARSDQRAAIVQAGDDQAAITAAKNAFAQAQATAKAARESAVEQAKKAYGIEVLRIQNDLAAQQIEIIRDQAVEITENDVRSVQERSDAVLAAMALDGQAQINKRLEESEKFKKIASELGERASDDEIQARLRVAAAQEAIDNKVDELIEAREKARAQARKKKAADPGELTADEIKKALDEAGLAKALKDAQNGVDAAHTILVNKMLALRTDVLAALRLKPEERTQAQRDLLASMNLTDAEMTQLLSSLENITRDNARATTALVVKTQEELKTAQLEAQLATITDVGERERLQKEIEARKTLQAELAALDRAAIAVDVRRKELADQRIAAGETGFVGPTFDDVAIQAEQDKVDKARLAAQARFRALQRKNELDALKDSNILVAGALDAQLAIYKTFYGELDKARRDDLQKQKDALAKAGEELIVQLQTDKIGVEEFFTERAKNRADQAKLDAELGGVNDNFWDGFSKAGELAFKSLSENRSKVLDTSLAELNSSIADQLKLVEESGQAGVFSLAAITDVAKEAGKEAIGVIGAAWGQMALSSRATLGDFADAAIVTSLKTIRTIIEGNIIGIISAAFAINPFLGLASIPAVFIIEALLAKWESDAQSRLGAHGFFGGGYTGDGDPHEVAGPAHKKEFYFDHVLTGMYRPQFEQIHKGVDPYTVFGNDEKWEQLFVTIDGELKAGYARDFAIERQVLDIRGALKPGNSLTAFYHTEAVLEAERETTLAVREQTGVMRHEFEKLRVELIDEIRKGNFELERNTKEGRATNDLIGKDGYGNTSIAHQLALLTKAVEEQNRKTSRW